ncbi:hypothetical protein BpHYR1_013621 [Brachionus plicatilis]|uniref:Uncharacterized protein n=1 Tax=Brachionus plicatilis TaxID=10195 RepID=A0A3M7S3D6_BRAPC|nr:hypothetical protein BpHYR1_013621 [Brachionus plicatilis]
MIYFCLQFLENIYLVTEKEQKGTEPNKFNFRKIKKFLDYECVYIEMNFFLWNFIEILKSVMKFNNPFKNKTYFPVLKNVSTNLKNHFVQKNVIIRLKQLGLEDTKFDPKSINGLVKITQNEKSLGKKKFILYNLSFSQYRLIFKTI